MPLRAPIRKESFANGEQAAPHPGSGWCLSYRPLGFRGKLPGPALVGLAPAQAIKLRAFSSNSSRPTIGSNLWSEARGNIQALRGSVMFLTHSNGECSTFSFLEGRRVGKSQYISNVRPEAYKSGSRVQCANFFREIFRPRRRSPATRV